MSDARDTEGDWEEYVNRLGNLTLLEAKTNRDLGRMPFRQKQEEAYASSSLQITSELCTPSEWDVKEIESRQRRMARDAVQLWRLDY